jgi:hypothetical protein
MKTLLQRIKDKEVKQVWSEEFGASKKILFSDAPNYPIDILFENEHWQKYSKDGIASIYDGINEHRDIRPYNATKTVQEIAPEPQPTLEEFADWVRTNLDDITTRVYCHDITAKELIELFKQSQNEAT